MRYNFTNEEVKRGDACVFIWRASELGKMEDDAPVGNSGETTMGPWHHPDSTKSGSVLIPVIVEDVTDEYVRLRFYKEVDGKFQLVYSPGHPEPVCLDILQSEHDCNRLVKNNWATIRANQKQNGTE